MPRECPYDAAVNFTHITIVAQVDTALGVNSHILWKKYLRSLGRTPVSGFFNLKAIPCNDRKNWIRGGQVDSGGEAIDGVHKNRIPERVDFQIGYGAQCGVEGEFPITLKDHTSAGKGCDDPLGRRGQDGEKRHKRSNNKVSGAHG